MRKSRRLFLLLLIICLLFCGCSQSNELSKGNSATIQPQLPEKLQKNDEGIPKLQVYNIAEKELVEMDIEEYVTGVVAGEMKNDWPLEALKAQAILARTFVLKFCSTKHSRYEGADISTSVEEAQAYAPENINQRVKQAVEDTRGMVMNDSGEYPHAWFFAHAGGITELPSVALDYKDPDPKYLSVVQSPDSEKAPENVKEWTATFSDEEVIAACSETGLKIDSLKSISLGEKGESGRSKTFVINDNAVSAPSFRIAIGANKLKSTLIDSVNMHDGKVVFKGSGFGHGVGMSQWGAFALAEEGKTAEEIIQHYFKGINLTRMW